MEMARAPKQRPLTRLVGENLAHWRKERGLSLAELSARMEDVGLSLNLNGLNKIERGTRGIDLDELVALARALKVPPLVLIFPLGREQALDVLPGTPIDTWAAAKWFTGEADLTLQRFEDWSDAPPAYFRGQDRMIDQWDRVRHARDVARSTADAELSQEMLTGAEDQLRRHRQQMRRVGLDPGGLPPELAHVDQAGDDGER